MCKRKNTEGPFTYGTTDRVSVEMNKNALRSAFKSELKLKIFPQSFQKC